MPKKKGKRNHENKPKTKSEKKQKETKPKPDSEEITDDDVEESQNKSDKKKKKKRLSKKAKVIIAVLVIIIVIFIGLWGMHSSGDYKTVSEVLNNKDKYLNKYVEVKGTVEKDSISLSNKTFIISDENNELLVNYTTFGSLPGSFEEGKDVVIKGTLREDIVMYIDAKEVVVGCASKY
jgi:cytochrome c-type biogenesis protein CcmE